LAKKNKIPVRCFLFTATLDLAKHLNMFREKMTDGNTHVPKIAYNVYSKKFQHPLIGEGFSEICLVNWIPNFKTELEKQLFAQYA